MLRRSSLLLAAVLALAGACAKSKAGGAPSPSPLPEALAPPTPDNTLPGNPPPDPVPEPPTQKPDAPLLNVIPVQAQPLVLKPASLFDLHGKTMRFSPQAGGYKLEVINGASAGDKGAKLTAGRTTGPGYNAAWKLPLPFPFAFGGALWTEVYVNSKGSLTLGAPEHALWYERDPWVDAGMRSLAAAIDVRAMDGKEKMIAPLWGVYSVNTKTFAKAASDGVLITWEADASPFNVTDKAAPKPISTFQVRLKADGTIEFFYPDVRTDAGIVGVFPGTPAATPVLLDASSDGIAHGLDPITHVKALRVYEEGTLLRFSFEMTQPVPTQLTSTMLLFRVFAKRSPDHVCAQVGLMIGKSITTSLCTEPPRVVRYLIDGPRVDLWVSKLYMRGAAELSYFADVVQYGGPDGVFDHVFFDAPRKIKAAQLSSLYVDLSAGRAAALQGNIYEVFHYAQISKDSFDALREIYKTRRQNEDFTVIFTDFPVDDLFAGASSSGASNVVIQGIGPRQTKPHETVEHGFPNLQGTMAPIYAGATTCDETGHDVFDFVYRAHAPALRLIQHELVHRWGMHLSFLHPTTKQRIDLTDADGHWRIGVNVPSVFKVSFTIADVVAAMGAREPGFAEAQRDFKLRVYMLHDGPAPRPEMLARAESINTILRHLFPNATGGRMQLK